MRAFAIFSTLAALLTYAIPATASIELPEWCHMGECSIQTLESKELLRSNSVGDLYLSTLSIVGYPDNRAGEASRQRFVDYHGSALVESSSQVYILCSSSMPSTLFVSNGREYFLNRLVLTGNPPSNSMWHSHVNYLATCHNIAGSDYFSTEIANMLIREGYDFGNYFAGNDRQIRVSNILEIMNPNVDEY